MSALDPATVDRSFARPFFGSLLSRGHLTRSVGVIAMGHAGAYGIMLVTTPILSRLFSPAEFGVLATYSAIMSLVGTSICLRYEAAIPLPRAVRSARSVAALAAATALIAAALWGVGLIVAAKAGGHHPRVAELAPYAAALALNLFAYGCFQVLTFWATRTRQFVRLAQQRLVLVIATVAAQVAAANCLPDVNGLIVGQLLGYMAAVGAVAWLLRDGIFGHVSLRSLRAAASAYRRFPQYGVFSETLHMSQIAVPPLVLAALFGTTCAGWFMLAWRIVGAPITLLVVPVARVYFSEAARIGSKSPVELRAFFLRTLMKCGLLAAPVLGAIAVAAPTVFPILLGDQWRIAGYYCRWLCPALLCHMFAISVRPTFDVTGRNDLQLRASAIGAGLTFAGMLAPCAMGWGASASIIGLSAGGSLAYIVTVILGWRAIGAPREHR